MGGNYPVHSYGSDQILNAWRQNQQYQKELKTARNNAITEAILKGAASGNIPNFKPGTPAYTGIERKFGSQFTQGLAERGQQAMIQQKMENATKSFETGMKFFNTANSVREDVGDKAGTWVKKAYAEAQKYFNQAGMNVDLNPLYDAKTNQDNLNKAATQTLSDIIGKLNESSSPSDIAAARLALTKFQENFKGKEEKDMIDVFDTTIRGVENDMRSKKQFERQQSLIKLRPQYKSSSSSVKKLAYAQWKTKPENKNKGWMEFETEWRGKGMEAKIAATEERLGRQLTGEEVRSMAIADPWGFLAPISEIPTEKYQVGQTIEKDGKTYKYIGNNKWQEQ